MESGRSAANLLLIINLDIWQIRLICVTGSICIFDSFPVEHVGIRFISRGTLTIINLDILHIRLICVTYCWCAKAERVGRAGDRRFKCDFDAKCICEKKPVVVSMLRRDNKTKICVFGPAK